MKLMKVIDKMKNILNKEFQYDLVYERLMTLKNYESICAKHDQSKDCSQSEMCYYHFQF
jgi:hypothetical protein